MAQRILVFESDVAFAQEVRSNFERLGATVDLAKDGAEGLDLAEAHRPDLILLSIELPGMNGFLVCKKIKKQDDLSAVPLLILSSEATEDVFEQHKKLRTRADDYIHKPIAFADLLERCKRFVALEANGSGNGAKGGDDAIEISDLEEDDVIMVAEEAGQQPTVARAEAERFAAQAVNDLVSRAPQPAVTAAPPIGLPAAPAPTGRFPSMVEMPKVPEPVTAVASVDAAAAEELSRTRKELEALRARRTSSRSWAARSAAQRSRSRSCRPPSSARAVPRARCRTRARRAAPRAARCSTCASR